MTDRPTDAAAPQPEAADGFQPLVSVVVPTRNSAAFLDACLASIRAQSYPCTELIVVDNHSTDDTVAIARQHTEQVFTAGPERSAQVNYGVARARGEYVYKVDADFVLDPRVVEQCVVSAREGCDAVVVHNTPDVSVGWIARVRKFEVDMYKYDLAHSSARFVRRDVYLGLGGFDESITAGEDYDFQNRLNRAGHRTGFVEAEALHLGEPTSLGRHLRKYYRYGKDFVHYRRANRSESTRQLAFVRPVYVANWRSFARHPLLSLAFVGYHAAKYASGALGFLVGTVRLTWGRRGS